MNRAVCLSTSSRPVAPARRVARAPRAQQAGEAPTNVCSTCGVDLGKKPAGCDGQGRVMGGLGAVPGFGWWPIKAYRPCPGLEQAGIEYVRKGQILNEVMFSGGSLGQASETLEEMKKQADRGLDVKP